MTERLLDGQTMDRLLSGAIHPDDAPPGFGEVAALIRRLMAPPSERELAPTAHAISAAVSILGMRPHPRGSRGPLRAVSFERHRRFLKAKVASLVVVGTLVGGTGMAVAGVLPAPLQDAASNALVKVGITVPRSHSSDGPATTGDDLSKLATTTTETGVGKGALISSAASHGASHAGENTAGSDSTHGHVGSGATGDQAGGGRNGTGGDANDRGGSAGGSGSGGGGSGGQDSGGAASGNHGSQGPANGPSDDGHAGGQPQSGR